MASGYDVAIIGAGASGLAAAQELSRMGLRVAIIEARDRIGGRVYTVHPPDLDYPIELGAEFIHGLLPHTWELLNDAGLIACEIPDRHWGFGLAGKKGRRRVEIRRLGNFWRRVDRALTGVRRLQRDTSFQQYAASSLWMRLFPKDRELVQAYVEGFNGAPAQRISVQSLVSPVAEAVDISRVFRPVSGYDALLRQIWNRTAAPACSVLLNTVVREIRWRRGEVLLTVSAGEKSETIEAPQAIITVPLGVLADHSLRFAPEIPEKAGIFAAKPAAGGREAFPGLEMGSAMKIILRLNHVLWEELGLSKLSFFHAPDEISAFQAWWTAAPMQVPVLTGWAGGPAALAMAGRSPEEIIELAVYSLSKLFSVEVSVLRRGIERSYFHDWQSDPYARGAYSYMTIGGQDAASCLARPVADTLFFAGEATLSSGSADSLSGTVDGAIATGRRAARELTAGRRALSMAA